MVIVVYKLTDFNLNQIPPGTIDHSWVTDENGHINAWELMDLCTKKLLYSIIKAVKFPNVSYGEELCCWTCLSREFK